MSEATSRDGTRIAFDRIGEGPSLILVGGALSDRTAAASLAEVLAPRFTVIAFDRRGRGDSGDTPPYAVEREVEDLEALIQDGGGSAFVFGHSSGAVLALDAAAGGIGILKLAVYEPPFIVDDARTPLPDDYVTRLRELVQVGRRGDAVEYFLTTGPGVPAEAVAEAREEPTWPAFEELAHTLAYDGMIMDTTMSGNPLPAERWASVRIPTLVMDGGDSPGWQRNSARALTDVLPDARHLTLEGQTHGADSEVLAPVLAAFFAEPST